MSSSSGAGGREFGGEGGASRRDSPLGAAQTAERTRLGGPRQGAAQWHRHQPQYVTPPYIITPLRHPAPSLPRPQVLASFDNFSNLPVIVFRNNVIVFQTSIFIMLYSRCNPFLVRHLPTLPRLPHPLPPPPSRAHHPTQCITHRLEATTA